jgi:translocation and assembly module TamB
VLNGTIQFQDPHDINPELFISARSHVNEYDVNLLIQGSAKNIQLRLSSMPPLTEPDIVSLLALGITSSHLEKNVQSKEQEAQSSYQIGSAILSKNPLNKQLQDRLGLNLQFSSAFDESRNVAVPKITLSKPLSNKLKASASRTFGDQSAVEVKLQYSINQNISAVGVYENREAATDTRSINTQQTNSSNIFGLDLEFKREFK